MLNAVLVYRKQLSWHISFFSTYAYNHVLCTVIYNVQTIDSLHISSENIA